jgi:hypothetical protein
MATDVGAGGVDGMVVEEVPHPPIYFMLAGLNNGISLGPPTIPSQNTSETSSKQYNGSASMQLNNSRVFDEKKCYKTELHRHDQLFSIVFYSTNGLILLFFFLKL